MRFREDTKGSVFQVEYVLAIGILTVLVVVILSNVGALFGDAKDDIQERQLEQVSEKVAGELVEISTQQERLGGRIEQEITIPRRIGDSSYTVQVLTNTTGNWVIVRTGGSNRVAVTEFKAEGMHEVDFEPGTIRLVADETGVVIKDA